MLRKSFSSKQTSKARDEGIRIGICRLTRAADKLTEAMESKILASNPLNLFLTKDMTSAEIFRIHQSQQSSQFKRKGERRGKNKSTYKWTPIASIILFIPPMSIPANNNPNRTSHHRYSVNQSRPGPGQTRTKEPSRSSRLGLLYVHCARAFTPLNTQRHGARFHGVGMYEPVQAGQRRRTWCPDRERERERGGRPPPKWVTYLYPLCVRWTPPLTAVPWIFCAPWHSPRFHVGNVFFLSFSPGFCYGPRLRIIRRVAGLRDWAGHGDGFSINGGCGLRMGMLFKSNRCWTQDGVRVEYVCTFDKNIKKRGYLY